MRRLRFYEVVRVLQSDSTNSLGIASAEGVVLGVAEPEGEGEPTWYSILVHDQTFSVVEDDLEPTGVQLRRDDLYDGSTIRADSEGRIIEVHDAAEDE